MTLSIGSKQNEEDCCLGSALTGADVAYVFSRSQLSTPEEGNTVTSLDIALGSLNCFKNVFLLFF